MESFMTTVIQKRRIKKFLKALRSGTYKQAKGALSENGGFCCLGVACDLYRKDKDLKSPSIAALKWNDRYEGKLPHFVRDYYGFDDENPDLSNDISAIANNDELDNSFETIANLFEEKYLKDQS